MTPVERQLKNFRITMTNSQISEAVILVKLSMKICYTEEYSICCSLGNEGDDTVVTFWEQRKLKRAGETERRY